METLMIIGAGIGQLPAIVKAKELGLKVVVIDKNTLAPGMTLADYAYECDIVDKEAALKIAEVHKVCGVVTLQSDLPVPTVGFINDKLGLKGASFKTANICSNKIQTRLTLKASNCAQPDFAITDSIIESEIAAQKLGFPCILKAVDSSGSRGVSKVNNIDEVAAAFNEALKYSRTTQVLVEEYIKGLEFGAQTFSVDGKCESVILHNDTLSHPPYMIPIGHSLPFEIISESEKYRIENDIRLAVETLGIENGPANVDLILDSASRKVKVIEVGARIGATCLPELVKYHTGIDWVEALILNAIGKSVDLKPKMRQPVAAYIISADRDGVFKSYSIENADMDKVIEHELTVKAGETVSVLRKGTDRIGKVVAVGVDALDAEQNVVNFLKNISLQII